MIICISGTPGTGKSTISKLLKEKTGFKYINVKYYIKKNKIYDSYDKERKCYIVDIKKLNKFLIEKIKESKEKKKGIIIDSLLSHYLAKKYVNLCVITKCNLKELKKRLEKRKYSKEKVRENLDSEIFDICLNEANEKGHNVFVLDTSNKVKKEKNIKELIEKISEDK